MPWHRHSFVTSPAGSHTHNENDKVRDTGNEWVGGGIPITFAYDSFKTKGSKTTSGAGEHNHSGWTGRVGDNTLLDNRPPFYRLAFIGRVN